jgi:hypothetical protein
MNDEFDESLKTIQEVSKTTAVAIEKAGDFGGFIAECIGGTIQEGCGIIEDKLRYMRWEREVILMQKAQKFLNEKGLTNFDKPIPLKFAVPLLYAALLEDDAYLQDLWAKLLVNSAIKKVV